MSSYDTQVPTPRGTYRSLDKYNYGFIVFNDELMVMHMGITVNLCTFQASYVPFNMTEGIDEDNVSSTVVFDANATLPDGSTFRGVLTACHDSNLPPEKFISIPFLKGPGGVNKVILLNNTIWSGSYIHLNYTGQDLLSFLSFAGTTSNK
ncbi:hypothetical protein FOL47_003426 [Perkinsus chesapeaki]|uniref:Uncharacterized protein n=1 Tax=Perkinsus chesapeaki TaxID=330153 RepID=A0A7J6M8F7_PERCH|nr:hypothetical protein FOL47_003426 [Perkinsus chesapeaki]